MRRHTGLLVFWVVFLAASSLLFAQDKPDGVSVRIGVAGDYFAPKLNDLNDAYAAEEAMRSLPQGKEIKSFYLGRTALSLHFAKMHTLQLEGAMSYLKQCETPTTNYLRVYYGGGSYLISPFDFKVNPYAGVGCGVILFNAQRTYEEHVGISSLDHQAELHGIVGVDYNVASRWTLTLEGRYMHVPKLTFIRPAMELDISTFSVGIGIQYSIFG
jgi:opacity protein-like surface antigen